jgi:ATP-dependent Lon protease
MEIIELSGYTEDEKLQIAKRHLVSKAMANNGIKDAEIEFKDSAIINIIRYYTREAGVRSLNRTISTICRKVVKEIIQKKRKSKAIITSKSLDKYLGVKKFRFGLAEEHNQVGEVTGLAWTSVGGDLLTIEAAAYKGKGKLKYTGQLGDVMQESIQAAMSVTRARAKDLGISNDFYEKLDIHIHVPDGSTPKDGPSAGAAMCTALVSVLTGRKVKADVAMTGEITLRGEVTPIGGLKEKMLAALRGGIKTVIIPDDNERELSEVPDKIKDELKIIKVKWIDEVLDIALEK